MATDKTTPISFRAPIQLKELLTEMANSQQVSVGTLINHLLMDALGIPNDTPQNIENDWGNLKKKVNEQNYLISELLDRVSALEKLARASVDTSLHPHTPPGDELTHAEFSEIYGINKKTVTSWATRHQEVPNKPEYAHISHRVFNSSIKKWVKNNP